ncbi:mandelate racemase/muconate lactonizing enzyme family protein [Sediminibacterium sp. TEGAF015]|uniref:mandelate racemase/muconate lactonizing enzyme family protein n=1 Tax=Sediminibacterium sp. TEGAF015 TaxID=575378 RepID=UPI002201EB38|nr:dipeptide epimerase [Sediminibacterium sp. TEGAF015]BDQ12771.1 dipeptide epimerase [Sediminibacterium sp. TEGAF015]
MKITSINSFIKHLPLKKPYTISYNTYDTVSIVFTKITLANGIVGIGTASPAEDVVGESPEQTLINLESDTVQSWVGADIRSFLSIITDIRKTFAHLPGTQAALDIALHDAFGKWAGISVARFYGIKRNALPTSVTIGIKSVTDTVAEAVEYYANGFSIFKLKTGLSVEEDIEKIVLLHEKFKENIQLRVDANQGYTLADLIKFMEATRSIPLELIEQPLKVGKEMELVSLSEEQRNKLVADESLHQETDAIRFAQTNRPFGIYNIKLMKCGGITGAREIGQIARAAGINLFWGCNDESIISITAALHTAYSFENTKYLDLDGSFDLAEDLVKGGFEIKNGLLMINEQPGLGYDWI